MPVCCIRSGPRHGSEGKSCWRDGLWHCHSAHCLAQRGGDEPMQMSRVSCRLSWANAISSKIYNQLSNAINVTKFNNCLCEFCKYNVLWDTIVEIIQFIQRHQARACPDICEYASGVTQYYNMCTQYIVYIVWFGYISNEHDVGGVELNKSGIKIVKPKCELCAKPVELESEILCSSDWR